MVKERKQDLSFHSKHSKNFFKRVLKQTTITNLLKGNQQFILVAKLNAKISIQEVNQVIVTVLHDVRKTYYVFATDPAPKLVFVKITENQNLFFRSKINSA